MSVHDLRERFYRSGGIDHEVGALLWAEEQRAEIEVSREAVLAGAHDLARLPMVRVVARVLREGEVAVFDGLKHDGVDTYLVHLDTKPPSDGAPTTPMLTLRGGRPRLMLIGEIEDG